MLSIGQYWQLLFVEFLLVKKAIKDEDKPVICEKHHKKITYLINPSFYL